MPIKQVLFSLFFFIGILPAAIGQEGPPQTEAEFEKQYQERIKKDKLNGIYIPKNLDDALLQLDKLIAPESQAKIKKIPEDSVCWALHARLGQWIMLNWGFYGGSRLSFYLRSAGITFPDDMADFILLCYHRRLNAKPYTIKEFAVQFREKRKEEFENEKKQGKIIHEEVRKKNR
ncbi:MAG: DUF6794 domain-containing protein [Bacteroidota bacterium]